MTAPEVNMAAADLWAQVTLGEGDRMIDDATHTISGRPLTADERALLAGCRLAEMQAGNVLSDVLAESLSLRSRTTRQLLELLAPWWTDDGTMFHEAFAAAPAGVQAEAGVLVEIMHAMGFQL